MKTKVSEVTVICSLCGAIVKRKYSIATVKNNLMTDRLEKILHGNLGSGGARGHDTAPQLEEYVGVIWDPPYRLLEELVSDRVALQAELLALDGHSLLTDEPESVVPEIAPDDYISALVLHEIRLRRALKRELKLLADHRD